MTLGTNEYVYQSDYMSVSPSADASVYSLIGDRIITGMTVTANSTGVTVTAGKALLQGRLVELKTTKTYNWPSGVTSGYVGLMANLTNANIDNGDGTIVNTQYTFGIFTNVSGDLVAGSTLANIPIANVDNTGWVTDVENIGYDVNDTTPVNITQAMLNSAGNNFTLYDANLQPITLRINNGVVFVTGAVKPTKTISGKASVDGGGAIVFNLPAKFIPRYQANWLVQTSGTAHAMVNINPDEGILSVERRVNEDGYIDFYNSTWVNLYGSYPLM